MLKRFARTAWGPNESSDMVLNGGGWLREEQEGVRSDHDGGGDVMEDGSLLVRPLSTFDSLARTETFRNMPIQRALKLLET